MRAPAMPCAFEKVRKVGSSSGKREITESDRLFGEAADTYATLFPKDKEIVTVVFKNGQFFFDYGDYDEAIKRFGLIVEKYPDDPNAARADSTTFAGAREIGIDKFVAEIAHGEFPHESTTDQWFSESQLESYRALGATVTSSMWRDWLL